MKGAAMLVLCAMTMTITTACADTVEEMLGELTAAGVGPFSAAEGRNLWTREYPAADGSRRACISCHSDDVRTEGRHVVTGKPIGPLAPSVDPQRLSDRREVEKWLRRNCKWTLGRECTGQEIGDVLMYLRSQ